MSRKSRKELKILIVDPNQEDLSNLKKIFVEEGVTVFSTDTMEKAVKFHKSEIFNIIISEYVLSEYYTVLDLIRRIKKLDGESRATPFIVHTKMRNRDAIEQAELSGVDKSFLKPLDENGIKKLIRSVKDLIKKYHF